MDDRQVAALTAALLEVLEQGDALSAGGPMRSWASSGHPHVDARAWHPQGADAYRLSGRLRMLFSKRLGRR